MMLRLVQLMFVWQQGLGVIIYNMKSRSLLLTWDQSAVIIVCIRLIKDLYNSVCLY